MKFTDKLSNFFMTKYYSNIKYNHSFASLLKIFFERANKSKQTVSSLGNVYRNSKWSDLRVQNIKQSHVASFFFLVIFIAISFLLLVQLVRGNSWYFLPLFSSLLTPWLYIYNFLVYKWMCIVLIAFSLESRVKSIFIETVVLPFHRPTTTTRNFSSTRSGLLTLETNPSANSQTWLPLLQGSLKSQALLSKHDNILTNSSEICDFTNSFSSNISLFLNLKGRSYVTAETSYSTSNHYTAILKFEKAFKSELSLNDTSALDSLSVSKSIESSVDHAKEIRWLFKVNPVTDKIINNNFNFTQAKALIGNPLSSSLHSSNNVWASNYTSASSNIQGQTNLPNNLTVVNFLETSSFWTMKKSQFNIDSSLTNLEGYSLSEDTKKDLTKDAPSSLLSASLLTDYSSLLGSHLIIVQNEQQALPTFNTVTPSLIRFSNDLSTFDVSLTPFLADIFATSSTTYYFFSHNECTFINFTYKS